MKKLLCLLLALCCVLPVAVAEEAATTEEVIEEVIGGEGQINFIEHVDVTDLAIPEDEAPFIPEALRGETMNDELAVIGVDNRIDVNPSQYPYSAVSYLEVRGACGCEWTASGFMVKPDWMMTAGHCLVCTTHHEWAKNITFYFGYRNKSNYLYRYTGPYTAWVNNDLMTYSEYDSYRDNDYGYVHLDKRVGDTTGWFGIRYGLSDADYASEWFNVSGYRHGKIKTSVGATERMTDKSLYHYADTEPGYSGCPIFDNEYYAVAINTGYRLDNTVNIGRRITADLYYDMKNDGMQ